MFTAQPRASLPPVARARRRHRAVAGILGALADIGGPGHGGDLRGTPVAVQDLLLPPFLSAQIHTDIFLRAGLIESHRKNLAISPPPPPPVTARAISIGATGGSTDAGRTNAARARRGDVGSGRETRHVPAGERAATGQARNAAAGLGGRRGRFRGGGMAHDCCIATEFATGHAGVFGFPVSSPVRLLEISPAFSAASDRVSVALMRTP